MRKSHQETLADFERRILVTLQGSQHVLSKNGDWKHGAGLAVIGLSLARAAVSLGHVNAMSMSAAQMASARAYAAFDVAERIVSYAESWTNIELQCYSGFEPSIPEESEFTGGACSIGGICSLGGASVMREYVNPITAAVDALVAQIPAEDLVAAIKEAHRTYIGLTLRTDDPAAKFLDVLCRPFHNGTGDVTTLEAQALEAYDRI